MRKNNWLINILKHKVLATNVAVRRHSTIIKTRALQRCANDEFSEAVLNRKEAICAYLWTENVKGNMFV